MGNIQLIDEMELTRDLTEEERRIRGRVKALKMLAGDCKDGGD